MPDKPTLNIASRLTRQVDGERLRFVTIVQTCWCQICIDCQRSIWPTHYFPRGVRIEDVEADFQVTHGHEGHNICDKCLAKREYESTVIVHMGEAERWENSKDPSITHDVLEDEDPKETWGDDQANY